MTALITNLIHNYNCRLVTLLLVLCSVLQLCATSYAILIIIIIIIVTFFA